MTIFIVTYSKIIDDVSIDFDIEIIADNEVEAMRKFFDKKINYRQIKNLKQQLNN
jgi:hypothetical protein